MFFPTQVHYTSSQVPFLDFNESEGEEEALGMDESLEDDGEIEGYSNHCVCLKSTTVLHVHVC